MLVKTKEEEGQEMRRMGQQVVRKKWGEQQLYYSHETIKKQ